MSENRSPVPWAQLVADPDTVRRYHGYVYRRGDDDCWWWLGAISGGSGHGKLRAGSRSDGTSRVVTAHVLGYAVHYGAAALRSGIVVRHRCDEPPCQNPRHWKAGERVDNIADYYARRPLTGHALADGRGPAGRAVAVRDAILATVPAEFDAVEAAITAALAAGHRSGDHQDPLW